MFALLNGGGVHRLTRAAETRRANAERDRAEKAENRAEKAEVELALRIRELAQVSHDHGVLQARCEELEAARQEAMDKLAALQSKLMHDWYEQARDVTHDVPAPGDLPDSVFRVDEDTRETPVAALWDAPLAQASDGEAAGETPAEPQPDTAREDDGGSEAA